MRYSVLKVLICLGVVGAILCGIELHQIEGKISTDRALASIPSLSRAEQQKYQKNLDKDKNTKTLLTTSLVGSITLCGSCIYIYFSGHEKEQEALQVNSSRPSTTGSLKELEQLKTEGLISNEEYTSMRDSVLKKYNNGGI